MKPYPLLPKDLGMEPDPLKPKDLGYVYVSCLARGLLAGLLAARAGDFGALPAGLHARLVAAAKVLLGRARLAGALRGRAVHLACRARENTLNINYPDSLTCMAPCVARHASFMRAHLRGSECPQRPKATTRCIAMLFQAC